MIWGSAIAGVGILLSSMTFMLIGQYIVLAVIGFTLFGIGLGFYATPSTDAALSNVPDDEAGAAGHLQDGLVAGQRDRRGDLGSTVCRGPGHGPRHHPVVGTVHREPENVALRFGGAVGILFNLLMVVVAIIAIMLTVPNERAEKRPEVPATPALGS